MYSPCARSPPFSRESNPSYDSAQSPQLILEYLKFNGYGHTASVMRAETGQPVEGSVEVRAPSLRQQHHTPHSSNPFTNPTPFPSSLCSLQPSFIRSELGVKGGSKIPVLYGVVEALKTNKENNGKVRIEKSIEHPRDRGTYVRILIR